MGYRVTRQRFPLDLSESQYEGMEVVMHRPSLAAVGDMSGLFGIDVNSMTKEDVARVARVLQHFAHSLASWNLEEDELAEDGTPTGNVVPIPPTLEGIGKVDDYVIIDLAHIWLKVLIGEGIVKADIPHEELTQ